MKPQMDTDKKLSPQRKPCKHFSRKAAKAQRKYKKKDFDRIDRMKQNPFL